MKRKKSGNILIGGLIALCTAFTATSCINDSTTDCVKTYSLTVRTYAADGSDITQTGEVTDVSLYVFDPLGYFQNRIDVPVGTHVGVEVPAGKHVTIVAWANASGTNDVLPALTPGVDHIDDCAIGLRSAVRSDEAFYNSPDDLFHGLLTISSGDARTEQIIPMTRKTGRMNVTVWKLREFTQEYDDDYSIVVRGTHNALGFGGRATGGINAPYRTVGTFNNWGVYTTDIFRLLPDSQGISIDVYHGDKLLRTVDQCAGEPITVTAGQMTNVLIDFSVSVGFDVRVSVTPWDRVEIWKDF